MCVLLPSIVAFYDMGVKACKGHGNRLRKDMAWINHVTVKVKDFEKEEAFYEAALTPLGYGKGPAFPGVQAFVAEDGSAVWVSTAAEGDAVAPIHVAFQAADNDAVKAFYEAGLANGGTDNGEPGPRPNYGPTYYAAFVHDPEGNNIEAMLA